VTAMFFMTFCPGNAASIDQSIQQADSSLSNAFVRVLEAEAAGGNITNFIIKLNSAGELLSSAQNAYRSGNLGNVARDADTARLIAEQVSSDASAVKDSSIRDGQINLILTSAFSVVGALVFLVVLFLLWRSFKRLHIKSFHHMKPKVVD
jgi:hypothetical protein